jgi:hypothetical protein
MKSSQVLPNCAVMAAYAPANIVNSLGQTILPRFLLFKFKLPDCKILQLNYSGLALELPASKGRVSCPNSGVEEG